MPCLEHCGHPTRSDQEPQAVRARRDRRRRCHPDHDPARQSETRSAQCRPRSRLARWCASRHDGARGAGSRHARARAYPLDLGAHSRAGRAYLRPTGHAGAREYGAARARESGCADRSARCPTPAHSRGGRAHQSANQFARRAADAGRCCRIYAEPVPPGEARCRRGGLTHDNRRILPQRRHVGSRKGRRAGSALRHREAAPRSPGVRGGLAARGAAGAGRATARDHRIPAQPAELAAGPSRRRRRVVGAQSSARTVGSARDDSREGSPTWKTQGRDPDPRDAGSRAGDWPGRIGGYANRNHCWPRDPH